MSDDQTQQALPWKEYEGLSKVLIVAQAQRRIFSAYRRDDYADPDGFVVQLGTLMEKYPVNVLQEATDPRNARSLQQRYPRFPPNIGEVAAVLAAEAAEQARIAKAAHQPRARFDRTYEPPVWHNGCWAKCCVSKHPEGTPGRAIYDRIKKLIDTGELDPRSWRIDGDNLWVSYLLLSAGFKASTGSPDLWSEYVRRATEAGAPDPYRKRDVPLNDEAVF
jgi:hypothetical protein